MPNEEFTAELEKAVEEFNEEKEEQNSTEEKNEVEDEVNGVQSKDDEETEELSEEVGEGSEQEVGEEVGSDSSEESEKKVEDTKKEPELQVISDYAITKAIESGMTVSEARSFNNDDSLLNVVGILEKNASQKNTVEEEKEEFKGIEFGNRDEFEPETLKVLDSMNDLLKKQNEKIESLESKTTDSGEQASRVSQEVAEREVIDWFDRKVSDLGEDFENLLGKGDYVELDTTTDHFKKRDELAEQVAVLMAGYQVSGKQAPSRDKLFDQATKMVLGDEMQKIKEKKLASDLKKRSKQHVNKSSRKNGGFIKGTDADPLIDVAQEINSKFFGK